MGYCLLGAICYPISAFIIRVIPHSFNMIQRKTLFVVSCFAIAAFGAGCFPAATPPAATSTAVTPTPAATPVTTDAYSTTTPTMTNETLAFPGVLPDVQVNNQIVRIKTTKGEIVFELLPAEGPRAASNFAYLAGKKFYDGLTFHRVEPGFVIQGGDPLGNGTGGPGYSFQDDPVKLPYKKGIVAMANAGPNTNGSQFFIMLGDTPLPPAYSIFGRVISGQEVVDHIAVGDVMTSVTVEGKK